MKYKTIDGNTAASEIAYYLSEVSAIYPITPSSTMAELVDQWASDGKKNIFDQQLLVSQLQSEAGVSGAIHGSLVTGALATTFTASQGLLLMLPNMYKIAGECLPCVFHVSARTVATHALSIFGDHSDVMAARSTGFNMISSSSVQECYDMALASHILTLKTSLPIIHFFDGFRTSHEIQKIALIDGEKIKSIYPYDKVKEFKNRALTPTNPTQKGTAQNPDVFFQNREKSNSLYNNVYNMAVETFADIEKISGRKYAPYEYYGAQDAEYVVVCMGSGYKTVTEVVDKLNKNGKKVGVVNIRLYRPFFASEFCKVIPTTVKKIAVLDRTKESGSVGEPLYTDVCSAIFENNLNIKVIGGRYGLGGKEFNPSHVYSVYCNLFANESKNHFTVGIEDDITNTSLTVEEFNIDDDCFDLKFYGLGSDGTVSANKNSIKIIGEGTDKYVQGYFEYDSKKSGSLTISHLRVSNFPINKAYKPTKHNFIAIHNFTYINRYDLISSLKDGGTVLVNTKLSQDELENYLPQSFIDTLKQKNAKLYTIDAVGIAREVGLGGKINVIMQTAFFKLLDIIPFTETLEKIKQFTISTYSKKGDEIVNKNITAINLSVDKLQNIDYNSWSNGTTMQTPAKQDCEFFNNVITPIENLDGDNLPVSAFTTDGTVPTNTSKYLKRGISNNLPKWIKENCIQCGQCTLACPHAAIRSVLVKEEDVTNPEFETQNAMAMKGHKFKIQLSPLDCTGCGVCVKTCPALKKALEMVDASEILEQETKNYDYSLTLNKQPSIFNKYTPKGLQFFEPYFEFNYACAGCGETPYIKTLTQLFGDRMIIANATGCSSIYGGSYPVCPYTKNKEGHGPAWANSLFEDNAEYGFGMALTQRQTKQYVNSLIDNILPECNDELKTLLSNWKEKQDCSYEDKSKIEELLKQNSSETATTLLNNIDGLINKSIWIIGGDGWAYDIGYGGLDHILNCNENVNVLVLDSEVYSNTGGQSSKSTPKASVCKFTANGKRTKKKDLGAICMAQNNCYVASISLGADPNQAIKALKEAEEFDGPSIVICYCPCINHGFDMSKSNEHMKDCVKSGYWNLYRYNPDNAEPLTLDSGEPTMDYEDFLKSESRYTSLVKKDPQKAQELFAQSKVDAQARHNNLLKILNSQKSDE